MPRIVIAFCLTLLVASRLSAQENSSRFVITDTDSLAPYRSPHRAVVLGAIIPGAGQIYAGEYFQGVLATYATIMSIYAGPVIYEMNGCSLALFDSSCKPGAEWPYHAVGVALVGMGIYKWVSTARDAGRAAERANNRHALLAQRVSAILQPFAGVANASRVGVCLHW